MPSVTAALLEMRLSNIVEGCWKHLKACGACSGPESLSSYAHRIARLV